MSRLEAPPLTRSVATMAIGYDYEGTTLNRLQEMCRDLELSGKGPKNELIARLRSRHSELSGVWT